ncbi:hypothetical protein [Formosa sp. S-31]|uniref:hypothetical protein n=1 Tax=Formosa sp. S-31 TaxID=2790949 RepID=UPI003EBA0E59
MWYSVDFYKLALNFQLIGLRKQKFIAWIYAFITPLVTTHTNWKQYRERNMYKLNHNGQVCHLRKVLNDYFDPDLRRIYIDGTGGEAAKTYIYTPVENQTKYLGTLTLFQSLEFADTGADFLVYVPQSIAQNQSYELRALIDYYRLGGKRYLIIELNE